VQYPWGRGYLTLHIQYLSGVMIKEVTTITTTQAIDVDYMEVAILLIIRGHITERQLINQRIRII
jgi:hypothetical protein